jgi:hypothetical protein
MDTTAIPSPAAIRDRMALCHRELAALRKLLRISTAIRQADEARAQRERPESAGGRRDE